MKDNEIFTLLENSQQVRDHITEALNRFSSCMQNGETFEQSIMTAITLAHTKGVFLLADLIKNGKLKVKNSNRKE